MKQDINLTKPSIIESDKISFIANKKVILSDISFSVSQGEILTIIGPNGAGKSTLLKILLGLLKPTSGIIKTRDGTNIGYMPQKININSFMPISTKRFLSISSCASKEKISEIVAVLDIEKLLQQELLYLSGGELQRVLLARAILNNPEILVLDEPTAGIDITGQAELYKKISLLKQKYNFAAIIVSHDLHLVMSETDKVICLNQHICCSGHPEQVIKAPEFIDLFGDTALNKFAFYAHNHDHSHKLSGEVINNCKIDNKDDSNT